MTTSIPGRDPLAVAYGTERAVVEVPRPFPNAQLILTTHSEQVIGSVDASSARRLVADGEAP